MRGKSAAAEDFAWIVAAYATALLAAWAAVQLFADALPLWRAAYADIAATLVIFAYSRVFDNSSFYDAYWSVAPPVLMLYWWLQQPDMAVGSRELVLGCLVVLWAVRLTHNWARGWQGLQHVDWRYVDLKANTGRWFALVDLFGIQLMPTILVFIGCLPLWLMTQSSTHGWHVLDGLWVLCGYGALWLEYRADNVLRAFRLDAGNAGSVLSSDVWGWCRHPNYLGELGFWLALGIAGFVASGAWLAWLGFVCMLVLFVGISIPMIDKRQLANKERYAQYRREVPALLPVGKLQRRSA